MSLDEPIKELKLSDLNENQWSCDALQSIVDKINEIVNQVNAS